MKKILLLVIILTLSSCSSFILKNVEFGWPIESRVKADKEGVIRDQRFAVNINLVPLLMLEFGNSKVPEYEFNIIRNNAGFYFLTAKGFKNVYIFSAGDASLILEEKVQVAIAGLKSPAFNQRTPNIELIDGAIKLNLNNKGIVKE